MRKGIDISKYQKNVDYFKLKEQGIEFAIIRCGYGKESTQKDELFETHYKGLKEAGIKVGCYLYSYCTSLQNSILEAQNCLNFIKGKDFDLPIFYDLEDNKTKPLGKDIITQIALNFCEEIENAGYKAGVYANLDWFKNYIDVNKISEKYYIWLAQWTEKHTADFRVDFWQYTDKGQVLGISGNVDMDIQYADDIYTENKKTNEEIALEVIEEKWGNGEERKINLTNAGYDYVTIQALVNQKLNSVSKIYYTVKKGDNLTKISKDYGTTVSAIVKLNNIADPNKIYVNQVLRIK